jgi:hypothetical protein
LEPAQDGSGEPAQDGSGEPARDGSGEPARDGSRSHTGWPWGARTGWLSEAGWPPLNTWRALVGWPSRGAPTGRWASPPGALTECIMGVRLKPDQPDRAHAFLFSWSDR